MAYSTQSKTLCSKCLKAAGILTCSGCKKDFCYSHVSEHRNELNKQMDEITLNHDQLQQIIIEQQSQPNSHLLIKQIDLWENNSIEKIHQAANKARKELLIITEKYRNKVTDSLLNLTQELNKARNDNDFVETDLNEWLDKIEKLKNNLNPIQTIDFGENDNNNTLISKIFIKDISNDLFQIWFGDIQINDYGKQIVHGQTNQIATVYSKETLLSGQHIFRIKIESLYTNQYLVFGIVSNETGLNSILNISYHPLKLGKSLIQHSFYYDKNGISLFSLINSNNIIQKNDILIFQINSDQLKLRVINERTNYQQEYNTYLDRCKLPWRMVIGLFHSGDSIRLC